MPTGDQGTRPPPRSDAGNPTPPAAAPACSGAISFRSTELTREQYINTASDLLGFDVRPLVGFDDSSGRRYVPGTSASALEIEHRQNTAEAIAAAAAQPARWPGFLPCQPKTAADEEACGQQFVTEFAGRAFRAPLTDARPALQKLFTAGRAAGGFASGVEWVVAGVLQAPDFLYQLGPRPSGAPGASKRLDGATLASRLAFFLWNSGPDAILLGEAGQLGDRARLSAQIDRLLADPRAARMRADHHGTWLQLQRLSGLVREPQEFTPALASDLRDSLLAGIEELYRGDAQVAKLWSSPVLFATPAMASLYGLGGSGPQNAPAGQRMGLLTHPALLTILAHPDASDPIARGVFVEEQILCRTLPEAIADIPELPPLRPGLSTRQRLEQHRSQPACAACHQLFDPIGMALENYDAIGRYRNDDHGVPVDSSGEVKNGIDLDGRFAGGAELLARLPASATVRDCLVQRTFEYALRRELEPAVQCAVDQVKQRFRADGDLRGLLAAVAASDAFTTALVEE
jgi:hypothetical protein